MGDAVLDFRNRVASGSTKLASRYMLSALREDPSMLASVAQCMSEPNPLLRLCAARVLADYAEKDPARMLRAVPQLLRAVEDENADCQEAALRALSWLAPHYPAAVGEGVDAIATRFERGRRPAVRESAAVCMARLAASDPGQAHRVVPRLAGALRENPRDKQAREILGAMHEFMSAAIAQQDRDSVMTAIAPLRGHPDLQVRERATRLFQAMQVVQPSFPPVKP